MAAGFVRQNATGTSTSYTITAAANGNTLVLYVAAFRSPSARTVSSLSCTNVAWTKLAGATNGTIDGEIWFGTVSGGNSGTTITITMSGSGSTLAVTAIEFSGVLTSGTINDGSGVTNTGTSTSPTTGAFSCTASGELLLSCESHANGTAPSVKPGGVWTDGTFANNSTTDGVQPEYDLISVAGAASASWTITSAAWVTCIGALKVPLPPGTWAPSYPDKIYDKVGVVPY